MKAHEDFALHHSRFVLEQARFQGKYPEAQITIAEKEAHIKVAGQLRARASWLFLGQFQGNYWYWPWSLDPALQERRADFPTWADQAIHCEDALFVPYLLSECHQKMSLDFVHFHPGPDRYSVFGLYDLREEGVGEMNQAGEQPNEKDKKQGDH